MSKTDLSNGLNNAFTTFSPRPTQTQAHKSEFFLFLFGAISVTKTVESRGTVTLSNTLEKADGDLMSYIIS